MQAEEIELMDKPIENPFESIQNCIAFDTKDFAVYHRDAWLFGIVFGWDGASMDYLARRHGWDDATVARLRRLHDRYVLAAALFDGGRDMPAVAEGIRLQARNAADRLDRDDSQLRAMLENCSGCGQILMDALHSEAISLLRMIENGELVLAAAGGAADNQS
jgi:hypothetical protein